MKFQLQVLRCMLYTKTHQFYIKSRTSKSFRVYRKSATTAQTDRLMATGGPLNTGVKGWRKKKKESLMQNFLRYTQTQ